MRDAYPRLFRKSNQKNSTVEEMYDSSNLVWDLTFRRRLFPWENEELYELKLNLNTITLQPNVNDSLCWRWDNQTNSFSVKSCYEKWEDDFNSQNHIGPLCKRIWKNLCPFKVEVFVWQALQEKVATGSELKKKECFKPRGYFCRTLSFLLFGSRNCASSFFAPYNTMEDLVYNPGLVG